MTAPRPAAVGTARGRVPVRGRKPAVKSSVKRRAGDRRSESVEGRRAAAAARAAGVATEPGPAADETASAPESTAALSEEEQIESAKYLPRHAPDRVFEEERFLFPESYGVDRVRLLVKDPEWLFSYWDLSKRSVDTLRRELGERGLALTRLTLRITDPGYGGTSIILLPYGARAWYVRADKASRSYRALLGWTLPSGQFRKLAESNLVSTPRVGPSPEVARWRLPFNASAEDLRAAVGGRTDPDPGPWSTEPFDADASPGGKKRRGGASDLYRR